MGAGKGNGVGNGLETAGKCQGIESVTFFGQPRDRKGVEIVIPMEMCRICALMPSNAKLYVTAKVRLETRQRHQQQQILHSHVARVPSNHYALVAWGLSALSWAGRGLWLMLVLRVHVQVEVKQMFATAQLEGKPKVAQPQTELNCTWVKRLIKILSNLPLCPAPSLPLGST